jgi:hypothetical protein
MLRETKEFKDFVGMADDSGNVRAINSNVPPIKIEDVDADWVPDPAFNLAHQFRQKHGNELTIELVNTLLADLNKIWREREKKQISRVKQQAREELVAMKR